MNLSPTLFPVLEEPDASAPPPAESRRPGRARVLVPDRAQILLRPLNLDRLLPDDHKARAVWCYVERLDVQNSPLYERILAVEGGPGRPAIDPRILLALWLYATLDGVGAARAIARLCDEHVAYQWICGGVSVNYHALADFRVGHTDVLERLLTHSVAVLVHGGIADVTRVAQDGIRVRASAGAASFRRQSTLQDCLVEAKQHVAELRRELDGDAAAPGRREQAAKKRAAEERVQRVQEALEQLPKLDEGAKTGENAGAAAGGDDKRESGGTAAVDNSAAKPVAAPKSEEQAPEKKEEKKEPRASTTDADARVMKMADGGFRPAFNIQFAATTEGQVVVGVDVSNSGSDHGKMAPVLEQVRERTGEASRDWLVDGGFPGVKDIESAAVLAPETTIYAPPQKPRKGSTRDRYAPMPGDSPRIAAWRVRMGTEAAQEIYRERASTIECVNAIARNRGLRQFLVRGLEKIRAIALWFALAHNVAKSFSLLPAVA